MLLGVPERVLSAVVRFPGRAETPTVAATAIMRELNENENIIKDLVDGFLRNERATCLYMRSDMPRN